MSKKERRIYRVSRIYRISGGLIAFFLLILIVWVGIVYLLRPAYIKPDTSDWHTGDIFFSVGDSWESVAVRALTGVLDFSISDSTPSHCGLVVRDSSGTVRIAHASTLKKKIVLEDPEEYLINNGSYCLFAKKPPYRIDSTALRNTLDSLINTGVPFDFKFDHSESASLYCSEMVITVFEHNGIFCFSDLRQQSYIYPKSLLNKCLK